MKKAVFLFFSIAAVIGTASILSGQQDDFSDVLKKVTENFKKIETLQSGISFQIHINDRYFFMKGDYISAPGNKYRMEFSPYGSDIAIVSNGKKVWFYVESQKKVYAADIEEGGTHSHQSLYTSPTMAGRDIFSEDFHIRFLKVEKKGWSRIHVYEAVPKVSREFVSKMIFRVDGKLNVIRDVETFDLHGNTVNLISFDKYRAFDGDIWFPLKISTTIREGDDVLKNDVEFNNLMINNPINDKIFLYELPEGVVIEQVDPSEFKSDPFLEKSKKEEKRRHEK